jgi:peptidoglycan-associated lipoprotein
MKKHTVLFCLAAAVLLFQGCASKPTSVPLSERIQPRVEAGEQQSREGVAGEKGSEGAISEEELARAEREKRRTSAEEAVAANLQDVYFDFDSYGIRSQDMPVLKKMAEWLQANPAIRLTIEGYCDERGTTEYNLALGQKRAGAVKDYFVAYGVNDQRLRTVSYGKEAPVDPGHTEEAWAKNRRAHFVGPQTNQ